MAAGATYEPIATTTLGSANASVTFSSISGSYTDLVLICSAKATSGSPVAYVRFNSDNGSNYSRRYVYGDGSTVSSSRDSNASVIDIALQSTSNFMPIVINLNNYSNTTTYKTLLFRGGLDYPGATIALWRSTNAISTVLVEVPSSTFVAGSTFTLYGIAAA
jgi:hypothetical protein